MMLQVPDWKLRFRSELIGPEAMRAQLPAWDDLCARSIEDNVYYAPRYALALIDHVERHGQVQFALVWEGAKLVALLPVTRPALVTNLLAAAPGAWRTDYTFSCMPLLDRGCAVETAASLVDRLGVIWAGQWQLPTMNVTGAACRAMTEALANQGRPWLLARRFQRATLTQGDTFEAHLRDHVSAKRRRDIARNRRRLEQLGRVAHESHRAGEGLNRAVKAFLTLEAKGWKGKRGTALACRPGHLQFAADAFTDSMTRADILTLNDQPIAVSLAVVAGRTAFTVKCTYDEAYRSFSVGLLLEIEVMRSFFSERWADRLDAATAGKHVIDSLWSDRIEVADLVFSLAPRNGERHLAVFERADDLKIAVKNLIRPMVERFRN